MAIPVYIDGVGTGEMLIAAVSSLGPKRRVPIAFEFIRKHYRSDACRTDVWEKLPPAYQRIIEIADIALMGNYVMATMVENSEALTQIPEKGVTLYDRSAEDRSAFRAAAQKAWSEWSTKTPETATMVASQEAVLKRIGLAK